MKAADNDQSAWSGLESEFPPIVKVDVTEEIIGRIKALLANGKLKPGSKLPPERELSQILGVGRPALRQALKALATMGIIDSQVGRGTFINASSWELLAAPMDFMMLLNAVNIKELFEVRTALEVELAGLASERATESEIAQLESVIERQQGSLSSPNEFLKLDVEFHSIVANASKNILFWAILDNLRRLMLESRRQMLLTESDLSLSLADHRVLYREIAARNKTGARDAMLHHLNRVYLHWKETQEQVGVTSTPENRG